MAIRGADTPPTHADAQPAAAGDDAALLHLALLVLRGAPAASVFAAVTEEAARRLGAEASAVLRFLGDERGVIVGAWREGGSVGFPVNAELDFDRRNSAAGVVRATRRPARVDNYDLGRGELRAAMRSVGLRSSVAAPILAGGNVWGVLVASTSRDQPLAAGSEHRLGDLAEVAGHAVAREEAHRALERSRRRLVEAGDEARRRLERKLHGTVQQHLLALTLKLRAARLRAGAGADVVATVLDDAVAEALTANEELREFARDLYPIVLAERGLAAAVQALAARARVRVRLQELPGRRYPAVTEATAYFVVAQAFAAAGETSPPPEAADVAVADRGDVLVVEVRHDGVEGTSADLVGLAERLAAVGGVLESDRLDVVRARIPAG